MNEDLKRGLLKSLSRFKKTGHLISDYLVNEMQSGLNIAEIAALNCIKEYGKNSACECGRSATAHDAVQSTLAVSKAAVSQIIGGLEEKGCVEREIDRGNRRKIVITLTDAGRADLENSSAALDKLVAGLIDRFGETKTNRLISLIDNFADLVEELGKEKRRANLRLFQNPAGFWAAI